MSAERMHVDRDVQPAVFLNCRRTIAPHPRTQGETALFSIMHSPPKACRDACSKAH